MSDNSTGDDFFDFLNGVIDEAAKKQALKKDAAKLKKDANNFQLSPRARAKAAAEWRAIQAIVEANQWRVVQTAAFFTEQLCDGCGSVHHNFLQYMQEEVKVKNPSDRRWVRTALPEEGIERTTIVQPLKTHICSDCCDDHGFNANAPAIRLMPMEGGLTVSATYNQGDINGGHNEA